MICSFFQCWQDLCNESDIFSEFFVFVFFSFDDELIVWFIFKYDCFLVIEFTLYYQTISIVKSRASFIFQIIIVHYIIYDVINHLLLLYCNTY